MNPGAEARIRLYCIPHAGGSAATFRDWSAGLIMADVIAIDLPGHGSRFNERLLDSVASLAADVAATIERSRPAPFALFGHSMGGLIAFEAARILEARGAAPLHLFVSAHQAPNLVKELPFTDEMPDGDLFDHLRHLGGASSVALADADVMALMLPVLRADLAACSNYRYRPQMPLACPITAFAGLTDPLVSSHEMEPWCPHTTGSFRRETFPAGHFFIQECLPAVLHQVDLDLEMSSSPPQAAPARPDMVVIDGGQLNLDSLMSVARDHAPVELTRDKAALDRIDKAHRVVERAFAEGRPLYGVTTRFGGLANEVLTPDQAAELQNNAIWAHKTGIGRAIDPEDVRASMVLRMNSLARGVSGARVELIQRIATLLNRSVTPLVYEFGSIGASGDLVPLTYVAGALTGSPAGFKVEVDGEILDAREALHKIGLEPLVLAPKEMLALINGTAVSTAIAARCVADAKRLFAASLASHGLLIEALRGSVESFDPFIHEQKPHPGQIWVAKCMREMLAGSRFIRTGGGRDHNHTAGRLIQDRYSIRCLPQFLGPLVEGMQQMSAQIEIEMNSATDNPLVDPEAETFCYGGNFLGEVPAVAMDHLRQFIGLAAKHLDAQIALVMEPAFNDGLAASLVGNAKRPVNIGLKAMQLTANSMMPLLTYLGNTFVDRFPTHAEQYNQNINSQSYIAAQLARESVRVWRLYVSVALLIGLQAVDLRAHRESGSFDAMPLLSCRLARLYSVLRRIVGRPADERRPYVWDDDEQSLDRHIACVAADLEQGGHIFKALGREFEP